MQTVDTEFIDPDNPPVRLHSRRYFLIFFAVLILMVLSVGTSASARSVKKPARSLDAVFHPDAFPPFAEKPGMNATEFEKCWKANPPWILANLAHVAYHLPQTVSEWMTRCGATVCHIYDHRGAFAFLAIWNDKAILSFRGTQAQSMEDLTADLLFLPALYGTATVHAGFLLEIDKIWPQIEADLHKEITRKAPHLPVWVTGHSLGGALATLSGMRYPFQAVVTFGEPPVGRNVEKMFIGKRHFRYVNGADPISNLPEIFSDYFGEPLQLENADGSSDWRFDHAIGYYSENLYRSR